MIDNTSHQSHNSISSLSIITISHSLPHIIIIMCALSLLGAMKLSQLDITLIIEWTVFTINSSTISVPIILDPAGLIFIATVCFISFNVITFSNTYIIGDPNLSRFTHMVFLFIISMLVFILSPNLITIILGWDGLGVTSFLLVIYYQDRASLNSGMVTIITNRIGDVLLLVAITSLISQGQWNLFNIWSESLPSPTSSTILILLAAITNSSQIPFHAWLPAAMAAPTPVSALVHSSTLVTAGVFLLIRLYPFLSQSPYFSSLLLSTAAITISFGGGWAITNMDVNNVVALSTISQLGLIITALSLGIVSLCYAHLLTHAIFNATLFITVGMSILYNGHNQNIININSSRWAPILAAAAIISLLSINAVYFLAGFYSNEAILESAIYSPHSYVFLLNLFIGTISTATYSVRLWRALAVSPCIQAPYNFNFNTIHWPRVSYINDNNNTLRTPIFFISLGSVVIGSTVTWTFLSPSDLAIVPSSVHILPPIFSIYGVLLAIYFCRLSTNGCAPQTLPFAFTANNVRQDNQIGWRNVTLVCNNRWHPILEWIFHWSPGSELYTNICNNIDPIPFNRFSIWNTPFIHLQRSVIINGTQFNQNSRWIGPWTILTYLTIVPVLTLAELSLNFVDRGWLLHHGTNIINNSSFISSNSLLNTQNASATGAILLATIFLITFTITISLL